MASTTRCVAAARRWALTSTAKNSSSISSRRALSSTARQASSSHGGHHESQYDPPAGWLFGVKPGEKYKNEGWEKPFFWGFCGSLIVFVALVPFKPDTS